MIRRFLIVFLAIGLLRLPLRAEVSLADLEKNVTQQVKQASAGKTFKQQNIPLLLLSQRSVARQGPVTVYTQDSQQEIVQALQKVMLHPELLGPNDFFWWNDFVARNAVEVAYIEERKVSISQAQEAYRQIIKNAPVTVQDQRPDYGEYVQQTPAYIYLTDSSTHSAHSVVNEVKRVLYDIQQKAKQVKPDAHILLALEFGYMLDSVVPMRFAGQENKFMYLSSPYDELLSVTDHLGIDVLALENWFFGTDKDSAISFFRLGNYILLMNSEEYPGFMREGDKPTLDEWSRFSGFVNMSSFGMRLRNEQWANYINAVKRFYDIIIVYGCNGHIYSGFTVRKDVPTLVGEKYIEFNFYTPEEVKEEQDYEEDAHKMLDESHARFKENILLERKHDPVYFRPVWGKSKMSDTFLPDLRNVVYRKVEKAEIDEYVKSLPSVQQHVVQKANETFRKEGGQDLELVSFDVYLPQWSGS